MYTYFFVTNNNQVKSLESIENSLVFIIKMDQISNEIRSTVLTSIKSPIDVLNLTKSLDMPVTTEKISTLDHVATTNLRNVHNIYSHLGYGDCK